MHPKYKFGTINPTNTLKSIHIIDIGYHDHTKIKAHSTKPRSHFYHLFHVVLEGQGTLSYKNKTYKLSPDSIFYLPPFTSSLYLPKESDPYKFVWIGVEGDELTNLLSRKGINEDTPILYSKNNKKTKTLLLDFLNSNTQRNVTEEKMLAFFFTFIDYIRNQNPQSLKATTTISHVETAKTLIESNYMHSYFAIHSISNILHLSHSWLCALFKRETGMSMHQYLISNRINNSSSLLINSNLSVNEISYRCGFGDPLYFSATFKKHTSLSPLAYRKKYKNT